MENGSLSDIIKHCGTLNEELASVYVAQVRGCTLCLAHGYRPTAAPLSLSPHVCDAQVRKLIYHTALRPSLPPEVLQYLLCSAVHSHCPPQVLKWLHYLRYLHCASYPPPHLSPPLPLSGADRTVQLYYLHCAILSPPLLRCSRGCTTCTSRGSCTVTSRAPTF